MGEPNRLGIKTIEKAILDAKGSRKPDVLLDGAGLRLKIERTGSARWALRLGTGATGGEFGLGAWPTVNLTMARQLAEDRRRARARGEDPRQAKAAEVVTFEAMARRVHEERRRDFRNAKHCGQWLRTLETYAFPVFGGKAVGNVTADDVHRALKAIWTTKAETARRVRQRVAPCLMRPWSPVTGPTWWSTQRTPFAQACGSRAGVLSIIRPSIGARCPASYRSCAPTWRQPLSFGWPWSFCC